MKLLLITPLVAMLGGCLGEECIEEVPYDGIDQDCDGSDLTDVDGDGFLGLQALGPDCDDDDPAINPDATDVPYDGIDQDCDGVDVVDVDQDGFDAVEVGGSDCDDGNADVHPGQPDMVGNSVDDNCDGVDGEDFDGDGYASLTSGGEDCNDSPLDGADTYPGAPEVWYDGIDQDCDGGCDFDQDGDGFVLEGHVVDDNAPCDADPIYDSIDAPADCNDEDDTATDNRFSGSTPADKETGVFGGDPVVIKLRRPEATATIEVLDPTGKAVPGIASFEGSDLQFVPNDPFDTFTRYDVTFEGSCGVEQFSFTTGAYGPPADTEQLRDSSFAIDLRAGTWTEPSGVGADVAAGVERNLLLGIGLANSSLIITTQATALADASNAQDECIPTEAFDTADFFDNPILSIGPADEGVIVLTTGVIPIQDLTLDGYFTPEGTGFGEGDLTGVIDSRDLIPLLAPGEGDDAVCDLEAKSGGACVACDDGSGDFCLEVRVESLAGTQVPGEEVTTRTVDDIAADASCDE